MLSTHLRNVRVKFAYASSICLSHLYALRFHIAIAGISHKAQYKQCSVNEQLLNTVLVSLVIV